MRQFYFGPGSGKTTEAIKLANETGAYLICINEEEKRRIREQCKRNPVSFAEFNSYGMKGSFVRNIVIDNFDVWLELELDKIMRAFADLKVDGITYTDSFEEVFERVMSRYIK